MVSECLVCGNGFDNGKDAVGKRFADRICPSCLVKVMLAPAIADGDAPEISAYDENGRALAHNVVLEELDEIAQLITDKFGIDKADVLTVLDAFENLKRTKTEFVLYIDEMASPLSEKTGCGIEDVTDILKEEERLVLGE